MVKFKATNLHQKRNIQIYIFKKLLIKIKSIFKEYNAKTEFKNHIFPLHIGKIRSNENFSGLHTEKQTMYLSGLNPKAVLFLPFFLFLLFFSLLLHVILYRLHGVFIIAIIFYLKILK